MPFQGKIVVNRLSRQQAREYGGRREAYLNDAGAWQIGELQLFDVINPPEVPGAPEPWCASFGILDGIEILISLSAKVVYRRNTSGGEPSWFRGKAEECVDEIFVKEDGQFLFLMGKFTVITSRSLADVGSERYSFVGILDKAANQLTEALISELQQNLEH